MQPEVTERIGTTWHNLGVNMYASIIKPHFILHSGSTLIQLPGSNRVSFNLVHNTLLTYYRSKVVRCIMYNDGLATYISTSFFMKTKYGTRRRKYLE